MLDGGADPLYVGRRMIRMASEDIGLADPRALQLTLDAVATYERLGTPEGELALAEAVIYLACAAKSNAVYAAYSEARAFIAEDGSRPVPLHLRNAPTRLMKELGYGKDYRYAHDEAGRVRGGRALSSRRHGAAQWYRRPIAGWKRESASASPRCAIATPSAIDGRRQALADRTRALPRRAVGRAPSSACAFARIDDARHPAPAQRSCRRRRRA